MTSLLILENVLYLEILQMPKSTELYLEERKKKKDFSWFNNPYEYAQRRTVNLMRNENLACIGNKQLTFLFHDIPETVLIQ